MNTVDIILIIAVAGVFTLALIKCVRNKKQGKTCCGDCSQCGSCSYNKGENKNG